MEAISVQEHAVENPAETELPRGLRWRGGVLWINKKIDGRRYQLSTGCTTHEQGIAAFEEFLLQHGQKPTAGSGRRLITDRPALLKGLYWKGNVIWLSRCVNGKHYNLSTGTSNVSLAKKFLEDFNLKAFKHEKLGVKTRTKTTFAELANRYLEEGRRNGLRATTLKRYTGTRDAFQKFLTARGLATADIQTTTPALIEDFKAWRSSMRFDRIGKTILGAASLRTTMTMLGAFFKHGVRLGLTSENPVSHVRTVRIDSAVPVYLEASEIMQLLDAARSFDEWSDVQRKFGIFLHDVIYTYMKTGMRLDELRHLQWSDVDLVRGEIVIRQDKQVENRREIALLSETVEALRQMKAADFDALDTQSRQTLLGYARMGRQEAATLRLSDFDLERGLLIRQATLRWNPKSTNRTIPMAPALKPTLERQPRISNLVFPDPDGGGLWRFRISKQIKRCAVHAKITKDIHTHTLRHTFATQLRRRGVALETIKELLGHANIKDTLIYAHFSQEEATAAIPKIDFF